MKLLHAKRCIVYHISADTFGGASGFREEGDVREEFAQAAGVEGEIFRDGEARDGGVAGYQAQGGGECLQGHPPAARAVADQGVIGEIGGMEVARVEHVDVEVHQDVAEAPDEGGDFVVGEEVLRLLPVAHALRVQKGALIGVQALQAHIEHVGRSEGRVAQLRGEGRGAVAEQGAQHHPKKAALIMTYADNSPEKEGVIINHYNVLLNYLGWQNAGQIIAPGVWPVGAVNHTDYPRQAYELGKSLTK